MIELKKLSGENLWVNPDHIRFVESRPDTLITFFDGKTIMVKESPDQIGSKIVDFRRSTGHIGLVPGEREN